MFADNNLFGGSDARSQAPAALDHKMASHQRRKVVIASPELLLHSSTASPRPWAPNQLRLVVFHEHEASDRSVLYDSERHRPSMHTHGAKESGSAEGGKGKAPRAIRGQALLGEMLYGSIPMLFDRPVSKIHALRDESSLMVSRVFAYYDYVSDDGDAPHSADDSAGLAENIGNMRMTQHNTGSYSALPPQQTTQSTMRLPSDARSLILLMPLLFCF